MATGTPGQAARALSAAGRFRAGGRYKHRWQRRRVVGARRGSLLQRVRGVCSGATRPSRCRLCLKPLGSRLHGQSQPLPAGSSRDKGVRTACAACGVAGHTGASRRSSPCQRSREPMPQLQRLLHTLPSLGLAVRILICITHLFFQYKTNYEYVQNILHSN